MSMCQHVLDNVIMVSRDISEKAHFQNAMQIKLGH